MRFPRMFFCFALAFLSSHVQAQQPANNMPLPAPHAKEIHLKHVLVIGQSKGFEHNSISAAMAAVYDMGKESGLRNTQILFPLLCSLGLHI